VGYFQIDHDVFFSLKPDQQILYTHIMARTNGSGNSFEKFGVQVDRNHCITTKPILMKAMGMDYRDGTERQRFNRLLASLSDHFIYSPIAAKNKGNGAILVKMECTPNCPSKCTPDVVEAQGHTDANVPPNVPPNVPHVLTVLDSSSIDSKESSNAHEAETVEPEEPVRICTPLAYRIWGLCYDVTGHHKLRAGIERKAVNDQKTKADIADEQKTIQDYIRFLSFTMFNQNEPLVKDRLEFALVEFYKVRHPSRLYPDNIEQYHNDTISAWHGKWQSLARQSCQTE